MYPIDRDGGGTIADIDATRSIRKGGLDPDLRRMRRERQLHLAICDLGHGSDRNVGFAIHLTLALLPKPVLLSLGLLGRIPRMPAVRPHGDRIRCDAAGPSFARSGVFAQKQIGAAP